MKESTENYLETILILLEENNQVRAIDIANRLGFSKPSISVAIKKLKKSGYIKMDGDSYILFTKKGAKKAGEIYEKHTVLTEALKMLGVKEKVAREDACKIEHHISAASFKAIKEHVFKQR